MDYLLHHLLHSSARRTPAKEALVCGGERLSYQQAAERVNGLASGLRRAGVQPGDRVGIYLGPSIAQALMIFAVSQVGAVMVPINERLFPRQVMHIVNDCTMSGLITDGDKARALEPFLATNDSLRFVATECGQALTLDRAALGQLSINGCSPKSAAQRDCVVDRDLAAILYTSGSTGRPKGIMLTHANIMAGTQIVSDYLSITATDRILGILPLTFDAGLNQLTTAFQQGGTFVMMRFVFARQIVQMLRQERITALAGVPTLWSLLVQPASTLERHRLPDLRYITNTGGKMPEAVLADLRRLLPATDIFLMYGLTEAFRATYLPPSELDRRPASIGKAIPNTEILVINERGQRCATGEVGELVQRGPTVAPGYWNRPDLNRKVFRAHPLADPAIGSAERVCYSGDLVVRDAEGFLYFVGRRDTMIKSSGYRISPTEIEEVLFQSGTLQAAAVVGAPDDHLGERIVAFVVPKVGARADAPTLLDFCKTQLPAYMLPGDIRLVERLPQTTTGKVDYAKLRRSCMKEAG